MKTGGLSLWRKSNSTVAVISLALVSGCVSASIDTPQALVGANAVPTASDVLSLDSAPQGFPTPALRPGTTQVALAPTETVTDEATVIAEAAVATPPAPPAPLLAQNVDTVETIDPADVNSRIASAEAAPVVGGSDVAATPIVEEEAVKPIAPPPQ
ncbi:MAG: hypothetical protein AAGF25_13965, partial [Pseudomonadota bacterium]